MGRKFEIKTTLVHFLAEHLRFQICSAKRIGTDIEAHNDVRQSVPPGSTVNYTEFVLNLSIARALVALLWEVEQ